MCKTKRFFFGIMILALSFFLNASGQAVLVHNTLHEIEDCKGKLKLELIRIWGGDEEEDKNKYFKYPTDAAIGKNGLVYICDEHSHCIKVFKQTGEYIRTIGQKGRGPGDIYGPFRIALSHGGDLVVNEFNGYRIQRFNPEGKSTCIITFKEPPFWVAVTSKDEFVVYEHDKTFRTGKLVSVLNSRGETIREIGIYHGEAQTRLGSEKVRFAMDENDFLYAANSRTPVIRKYSRDGGLLMAFTYEPPYEILPVKITLNARGDEINRVELDANPDKVQVTGKGKRKTIQRLKGTGKRKLNVCWDIEVDAYQRTYLLTMSRNLTEKEKQATRVLWSSDNMIRKYVDFNIADKIDAYRLLVFNPDGKIIAEAQLESVCDGIHVHGDRLFIIDGSINQRIREYRMSLVQ